MKHLVNIESITMPAGTYWVLDPCYAIKDNQYGKWLRDADNENCDRFLVADISGRPVVAVRTAYGDGHYYDQEGNDYPVDAGIIGAVPVEVAKKVPDHAEAPVVTFEQPFTVSWELDEGVIQIGHLRIPTDPEDNECSGCGFDENDCRCYDHDEDVEGEEDGGW